MGILELIIGIALGYLLRDPIGKIVKQIRDGIGI